MAETKKVLLINTHLTYPNWTEGTLNNSFYQIAKEFFLSKSLEVLSFTRDFGTTFSRQLLLDSSSESTDCNNEEMLIKKCFNGDNIMSQIFRIEEFEYNMPIYKKYFI